MDTHISPTPYSQFRSHGFECRFTHRRRETHEDVSLLTILYTSRPERITLKVELLDVVITFSSAILTVNYLRLLWMELQSTGFKALS